MIRRQKPPQIAHEEVADPVAIQINRLDVGRVWDPRDHTEGGLGFIRAPDHDAAVPHVRRDDLQALVAVIVEQPHVCHGGRRRRVLGRGCGPAAELQRAIG